MTNKIKTAFLSAIGFLIAAKASADSTLDLGWQLPDNRYNLPDGEFEELIVIIIDWFLEFIILLAILVIVFSGITYIASSGDQERTTQAKKTTKYALMGLAMAGIAYAAVNLVVTTLVQE